MREETASSSSALPAGRGGLDDVGGDVGDVVVREPAAEGGHRVLAVGHLRARGVGGVKSQEEVEERGAVGGDGGEAGSEREVGAERRAIGCVGWGGRRAPASSRTSR